MKLVVLHLDVKSRLEDIPFIPFMFFFLSLSRYILLMIPFICVILRLHLPSVPTVLHICPSIRLPSCVLIHCIVCLFAWKVNSGMDVWVIVRVTFAAPIYPTLPPAPSSPSYPCPLIMCG